MVFAERADEKRDGDLDGFGVLEGWKIEGEGLVGAHAEIFGCDGVLGEELGV